MKFSHIYVKKQLKIKHVRLVNKCQCAWRCTQICDSISHRHFQVVYFQRSVFQSCKFGPTFSCITFSLDSFPRPLITPLFGQPDRRTYFIEYLYACIFIVTDLYIVGQKKTFDFYFSSMVHKMLQSAVNHLYIQCCLMLSLMPTLF